jgi:hypothetical protein
MPPRHAWPLQQCGRDYGRGAGLLSDFAWEAGLGKPMQQSLAGTSGIRLPGCSSSCAAGAWRSRRCHRRAGIPANCSMRSMRRSSARIGWRARWTWGPAGRVARRSRAARFVSRSPGGARQPSTRHQATQPSLDVVVCPGCVRRRNAACTSAGRARASNARRQPALVVVPRPARQPPLRSAYSARTWTVPTRGRPCWVATRPAARRPRRSRPCRRGPGEVLVSATGRGAAC